MTDICKSGPTAVIDIRRIPKHVAALDQRGRVRISLKTTSLEVARVRRDALEKADDHFLGVPRWRRFGRLAAIRGGALAHDDIRFRLRIRNRRRRP